jgi:polysaccharide pyruvyl transferase WcaK-like protein
MDPAGGIMRIAYFVNSFNAINWGGQATSAGLKRLVEQNYPHAEFVPLNLPKLPFRHCAPLRAFFEHKLARAILADNVAGVASNLRRLNISLTLFNGFDTVCFNGEGAIHARSGHLIRLMGMLYYFKHAGCFVSALNQTVDLGRPSLARKVVAHVYRTLDYVSAREPVSFRELVALGVRAQLVPDAAYALPRLSETEIEALTSGLNLPPHFIGVTGSSALSKSSTRTMDRLLTLIHAHYQMPIVFLANAKTDIALAKALSQKHGFLTIQPPVRYEQAMAVVAKAHLIIGGRQHPNIFAAMHRVPFVPFRGNTHKMEGVVELLGYPLHVLPWNSDARVIQGAFLDVDRLYDAIRAIDAPRVTTLVLSQKGEAAK